MKMETLVDRYLKARRDDMGQATFDRIRSTLTRLAKPWDATRRSASSITEDWVRDWLYDLRRGQLESSRGKPLAPASYNKSVQHVRAFLEYLTRRQIIGPYVVDACKLAPTGEPKEYLRLSAAQIVQMIETTEDPWERWVLAFASQTLGRDSELRNRRIAHLRLDLGELDWYRKKTFDADKLPLTKQFVDEWQRWAMVYQEHCGPLDRNKGWFLVPRRFSTPFGANRWYYQPHASPARLAPVVQKHAARITGDPVLSLKGQGVHITRRSMARALYDRLVAEGFPEPTALNRVQVMLGHASPATTMVYIGVQPDRLKRNELLTGSSLLWVEQENVVNLRAVGDAD
jgi:integrase